MPDSDISRRDYPACSEAREIETQHGNSMADQFRRNSDRGRNLLGASEAVGVERVGMRLRIRRNENGISSNPSEFRIFR